MRIEGGHSECIGVFGVFLRQLFAKRQIQALSCGELYSVVVGTIVCRRRNYSLFGLFLHPFAKSYSLFCMMWRSRCGNWDGPEIFDRCRLIARVSCENRIDYYCCPLKVGKRKNIKLIMNTYLNKSTADCICFEKSTATYIVDLEYVILVCSRFSSSFHVLFHTRARGQIVFFVAAE